MKFVHCWFSSSISQAAIFAPRQGCFGDQEWRLGKTLAGILEGHLSGSIRAMAMASWWPNRCLDY